MPFVRVPTPLRPYTDGQKDVEVSGQTVAGALEALTERYPAVRTHLFDEAGALRSFVHVFLGEQDVRELHGEATELRANDRLLIIPSIAGGSTPARPVD
jgi:adenylyltransferase/sulfurtransferase